MSSMWLKIKIWTKVVVFALVSIYLLVFYVKNNAREVQFWYWYNREPQTPMLLLAGLSFLAGVLIAILVRMMFKTIHQVRDMRNRSRTERLEREVADMKAKAARLQTKTSPAQPPPPANGEIPLV